ncbi:hypothetical protein ABM055_18295 [Morganella morganii]|uniref:hypothetical protein n=1 Tax=Morganellaceae TaxID=1903414 RepID=UPI0008FBB657|nr:MULTISPECIES: hypothetical protein [Morganellaceae]MCL8557048.1 hypothetical protein [Proteus mirabilis]APC11340.1 hypothetical protein RB151_016600 [Providencia rettgeri]ARV76009.1 hypothetical protein PRE36_0000004693 [Providencia rettgeri]MBT0459518.1 hypothetical protein [Morganella morganii subsp. morganii]MBZ3683454.1 hypothetical protein [Providencia rettgeri]
MAKADQISNCNVQNPNYVMAEMKRDQTVLNYALFKAREKLHELKHLMNTSQCSESEIMRYNGVLEMLDSIFSADEKERQNLYHAMIMSGVQIMSGKLSGENRQAVLEATTPDQLDEVLKASETEVWTELQLLSEQQNNLN